MATSAKRTSQRRRAGFTLFELILVLSVLVLLTALVLPNFQSPLERSHLPESAVRLRALMTLTRAQAMLEGHRYRLRFLDESEELFEELPPSQRRQPLIEVEDEPVEAPGEFRPVRASWAQSKPFLGDVWCYQLRWGEPTYEGVLKELEEQELELEVEEDLKRELGLEEDEAWVLLFEPDGTTEWMTFRLIDVPQDEFDERDLMDYPQLDVIVDGRLGAMFIQRPLSEDEIEVLMEKGHSPVLRRDFTRPEPLTEDDVLEIDMGPQ